MVRRNHRNLVELLAAYREYLRLRVSRVRILGEANERELKEVFVELSVIDRRGEPRNAEFLGMVDVARRQRFVPFSRYGDRTASERDAGKKLVKPKDLLSRKMKAIITGVPGSGKSTLLKYLALKAQENQKRLVMWLELKTVNKTVLSQAEKSAGRRGNLVLSELWLRLLRSQLSLMDQEVQLLRSYWRETFKANEIAVLLDGFDEIQDEGLERILNKGVMEFVSASDDNTFLISTRPYARHKFGNERLQEFEIQPLTQHQVEEFLNSYYPNDPATKSLLKALRDYSSGRDLLHVPLLLGMVLRLHREERFKDDRLQLYETIVTDLGRELDRSKSVIRQFKINNARLHLDFLKFLAFELLLRHQLVEKGKEVNRIAFNYNFIKEKAKAFLIQERLSYSARDLADDILTTSLLREVESDTFAFIHLILQEYLAAVAFADFYESNEFAGLRIFCRAYHDPTIVEMEVLPMMLGVTTSADKLYVEIERWPESLTFANFRLRVRGLTYAANLSGNRLSRLIDLLLAFILAAEGEKKAYRQLIIRSMVGMSRRAVRLLDERVPKLLKRNSPALDYIARALEMIGSEKAVDIYAFLLRRQDSEEASYGLGRIGSEKAVDVLISNLRDDENNYRSEILWQIGNTGSERAIEILLMALADRTAGYYVHLAAGRSLRNIVSPKAIDALASILKDKRYNERWTAAESLGWLGSNRSLEECETKKAVDALISALSNEKDDQVRRESVDSLGRIGSARAIEVLTSVLNGKDEDLRSSAVMALGWTHSDSVVGTLISVLDDNDSYVREGAVRELGNLRAENALDGIIRALNDDENTVRWAVPTALGEIGTDKAFAALAPLLKANDSSMRSAAARALEHFPADKIVDLCISALDDKDSFVRGTACELLGKMRCEKAIDALISAMHPCEFGMWKSEAAGALGRIGSEKAVAPLISVLNDKTRSMRHIVASALGEIGSEKSFAALASALTETNDSDQISLPGDNLLAWTAARELGNIRSEKAVEILLSKLMSDDDTLSENAAEGLAHIQIYVLVTGLERALLGGDHFARKKAAIVIGYYATGPQTYSSLLHLAQCDVDREVRKGAKTAAKQFARKRELLGYPTLEGIKHSLSDNESRELFLIGEAFKITAEAGHIFRPTANSDWGIDGEIEFKNDKGEASGQRVYLQLKSGDSHLQRRKRDGREVFWIKNRRHAEFWQAHAYPVLLVIRDSSGQIRWMNVTEYLKRHGATTRQIIFEGEPFTAKVVKEMRSLFSA